MEIYVYYIVGVNSIRSQILDMHSVLENALYRIFREGSKYDGSNIRVCQHLSEACRAAHTQELWSLLSARLLRELDDDDVAVIKRTQHKKVAVYWSVLIGIPTVIASITSSDLISDFIKQCIPPLLVGGFLLLNTVLADISIYAIIIPYCTLFAIMIYLYFIYYPAKKRWTESISSGMPYHSHALQLLDRVIMLFTYDGIKRQIFKSRRSTYSRHKTNGKHDMNVALVLPSNYDQKDEYMSANI